MFLSWGLQSCGHTLMSLLQRLGRSTKTLKYIFTSRTGFSVWVVCVCVCVCEAPSQNTLKTNFVFLFAVEEILVCSDRSQPEILQGLHRRGGAFTASLFYLSRWDRWAVLISSLASVFFRRLPTWMARLTCRPAAMWRSTRLSATTASKYTWETVASPRVCF